MYIKRVQQLHNHLEKPCGAWSFQYVIDNFLIHGFLPIYDTIDDPNTISTPTDNPHKLPTQHTTDCAPHQGKTDACASASITQAFYLTASLATTLNLHVDHSHHSSSPTNIVTGCGTIPAVHPVAIILITIITAAPSRNSTSKTSATWPP
eukprot:jgi/Tetstr1/438643/TSEL_027194.t1